MSYNKYSSLGTYPKNNHHSLEPQPPIPCECFTYSNNKCLSEMTETSEPSLAPLVQQYTEGSISATALVHESDDIYLMHKFSLYETATRYYIVGGDVSEQHYRILKVDRTSDEEEVSMIEDKTVYTQNEMNQLLEAIDDGNKGTGGIRLRCTFWGLLGFIRFTGPYYMILITRKSTAAVIGGHHVYQIEGTEMIPLTAAKTKSESRNPEEPRFVATFSALDLTKSFYFCYSYDISRTLQHNILTERARLAECRSRQSYHDYNSMFIWNTYLMKQASAHLKNPYDWCRATIHGFIDQSALNIFGRIIHITIIARRSRHYAGVRFLKRGVTDDGYVANEVETEQIVSEAQTTSFHNSGPELFSNPRFTSYVQHRGSIPLSWTQDTSGVSPKPPIIFQVSDPFYSAAAIHFDDLFRRYGTPIYVLDLVKSRERHERESKLLKQYMRATKYLNQFLPPEAQIFHKAWDMSRASKSRDQDVIATLENIAEDIITRTGFFHNRDHNALVAGAQVQDGIVRTNCIDCLDRTNAAQFVVGKRALGHQLYALGVLPDTTIEYDTDAVNMLTNMYHDHGDTIALQYAGSQLVNTVETYRKTNYWSSNSRDMLESFKRFYNNSFLDGQRQQSYNLFLGNYVYTPGMPYLWDMASDFHLHNPKPCQERVLQERDYINWFTPKNLKRRELPQDMLGLSVCHDDGSGGGVPATVNDYWHEYYRPTTLSSFHNMFVFRMKSTLGDGQPPRSSDGNVDMSPFRVRVGREGDSAPKRHPTYPHEKQRKITTEKTQSMSQDLSNITRGISLPSWLPSGHGDSTETQTLASAVPTAASALAVPSKLTPHEKFKSAQSTFTKAVQDSLDPTVSAQEAEDYLDYIVHPHALPLVVSAETPADVEPEYVEFVYGSWRSEGLEPTGSQDMAAYAEMLNIGDDPLNVTEGDSQKKRYKAYRKWLQGKSFFKQHPAVDWPSLE